METEMKAYSHMGCQDEDLLHWMTGGGDGPPGYSAWKQASLVHSASPSVAHSMSSSPDP